MACQLVVDRSARSAQLAPDGAGRLVRARHDVRGGGCRPVPGVGRGDWFRMLVVLRTFRFEHDAPADKSKGELFPTTIFSAGYAGFFTNSASEAV